jgi:hypothetical protein
MEEIGHSNTTRGANTAAAKTLWTCIDVCFLVFEISHPTKILLTNLLSAFVSVTKITNHFALFRKV